MFIRLTVSNKDGQKEKRLVNIADISVVKPAPSHVEPALSCVTLISRNDFPIWARETVEALSREGLGKTATSPLGQGRG